MASSDSPASEPCATESVLDVKALLAQGQQSLKSGDVTAAIDKCKDVCVVLESQFGEGSLQVAEAYLLYGQALLLKSSDDSPAIPETKSAAADAAPGGAGDTVLEESKECSAESSSATVGDLASGDPDAAVNVQLAEKVLGYAKEAFSSGDDNETKVKYSSALLGLAKCSLEKKAYDVSIAFLEQSCEALKLLSVAKSEVSLETHYWLGASKNQVEALKALNIGKTVGNDILASTEGESENPSKSAVAELLKKVEVTLEAVLTEQGENCDSSKASEEEAPSEPAPEPVPASSANVNASDNKEVPQDAVVAENIPAAEGEELKADAACLDEQDAELKAGAACVDEQDAELKAEAACVDEQTAELKADAACVDEQDAELKADAASADEALPTTESMDAVVSIVQSNGTCNKRPLHEDDQEIVKKAKHEVDSSENGENDVDDSAAANADGVCEEPCST